MAIRRDRFHACLSAIYRRMELGVAADFVPESSALPSFYRRVFFLAVPFVDILREEMKVSIPAS